MSKLNSLAISENGFIFKPSTGESYTTNEIGLLIIQLLKMQKSDQSIISEICKQFEVDETTVSRDFYDFLSFLKREKFID